MHTILTLDDDVDTKLRAEARHWRFASSVILIDATKMDEPAYSTVPTKLMMLKSLATRIDAPRRAIRRRWRKLLMRSWSLSRWHYSRYGMVLDGRPSDRVWYFAYGSNMHHSAFRERRGMKPSEWRVARVPGYRLRFNLDGRPSGKAAPANICLDPDCELWGVLYRITRRELLRLDSTEGVPGRNYRHVLVPAEDLDGNIVTAVTYMARGRETDGLPSLRYISLLRDGARAHGLPHTWLQYLDSVKHHAD